MAKSSDSLAEPPEVKAIKMEILIRKIWKRKLLSRQGDPNKLCNSDRRRILLKIPD